MTTFLEQDYYYYEKRKQGIPMYWRIFKDETNTSLLKNKNS